MLMEIQDTTALLANCKKTKSTNAVVIAPII